jgi:hypothetical protein
MPPRDVDNGDDVFARARDDHAKRLDLVDAGVGGVQRPRERVEPDLTFDRRFEVALEIGGGISHAGR